MPFIMEDILSEIVLTNTGSYLLGITFAVLTLLEELIEIEIEPIRSELSATAMKHPFAKDKYFMMKLLFSELRVFTTNLSEPTFCIILF
jgi:hypothetical protein